MDDESQNAKEQKTAIAPMLPVRNGVRAIEFYKAAFGASESFRIDDESGAVVARLSVGEAEFWLADESPEHLNFSPESLGGGSVRMVMIVNDPDAAVEVRLDRLRLGNFGDARPLGRGLSELRIDVGPGYRVYFITEGQSGHRIVVRRGQVHSTKRYPPRQSIRTRLRKEDGCLGVYPMTIF